MNALKTLMWSLLFGLRNLALLALVLAVFIGVAWVFFAYPWLLLGLLLGLAMLGGHEDYVNSQQRKSK